MNFLLTFNKSIPLFPLDATLAKGNRVCFFCTLLLLMGVATSRQSMSYAGGPSLMSQMLLLAFVHRHDGDEESESVGEVESDLKDGQNF